MGTRSTRRAQPRSGRDATDDSARPRLLAYAGVEYKPYPSPRLPSPRRMASNSSIDMLFDERIDGLYERLRLLERTYNPRGVNLHFDPLPAADAALLEGLLAIGCESWMVASHYLTAYCCLPGSEDDCFNLFYDLFQLVGGAAGRINRESDQSPVSIEVIRRLSELLVHTAQYSVRSGGDIYLRNNEALASIILNFYDPDVLRRVRSRARAIGSAQVKRFVEETIARVEEVRAERSARTEPSSSEGGGTSEFTPTDTRNEPPRARSGEESTGEP